MEAEVNIRCGKCGADNREGAKFCSECATPFAAKCSKCGATNKHGAKFCDECGASLSLATVLNQSSQPVRVAAEQTEADASVDGERKTVTALFADIKGSTELEQDLDPEEAHGKVPAMVHDAVMVFESPAIALYLTDAYPKNRIGPKSASQLVGPIFDRAAFLVAP